MSFIRAYLTGLLFLAAGTSQAQSYQKTTLGIRITTDSLDVDVQFYSPEIVRIVKSPKAHGFTKESLSVIKTPQKTVFNVKQRGRLVDLKTEKLQVSVDVQSGDVDYSSLSGVSLLKEKKEGAQFTPFDDAGNKTWNVFQSFVLDKDESIYGLGQQQRGKMVQRNLSLNMVQGNTDDYVPFFQSVKGYGIFWDNYSPTRFTDNPESTSFKSDVGDCIDYYFMYGGNADGVIARMRDLTGQAPMFPLWTYGYWQSKEQIGRAHV